jgi:hypothetical protein
MNQARARRGMKHEDLLIDRLLYHRQFVSMT